MTLLFLSFILYVFLFEFWFVSRVSDRSDKKMSLVPTLTCHIIYFYAVQETSANETVTEREKERVIHWVGEGSTKQDFPEAAAS